MAIGDFRSMPVALLASPVKSAPRRDESEAFSVFRIKAKVIWSRTVAICTPESAESILSIVAAKLGAIA